MKVTPKRDMAMVFPFRETAGSGDLHRESAHRHGHSQAQESCPKSKWGRYCYRPHSHQRVVSSSGEPSEERLAPDVFPSSRQAGFPVLSPALAPASGSFRSARPIRRSSSQSFRFRDLLSRVACCLWRLHSDPGLSAFPSIAGRDLRPCCSLLSRSSRTAHLLPVETLGLWSSKTARTVTATSEWLVIFPDFKSLDRHSKRISRPSDDLKLRLRAESFKLFKPEFSTFPQIRCRREWISQRFVASSSKNRNDLQ